MKIRNQFILWVVLGVVVAFFIVVVSSPDWLTIPGTDGHQARLIRDDFELDVFYQRGSWISQGTTPYNPDIFQEYPQLGLAYISWPYLFSEDFGAYRALLISLNLIAFLGLIFFTYKIFNKLNKSYWYLLLFLLPSVVYFSFSRFDVFVALLVQICFYLLLNEKYRLSVFILALAFLTKWYPILFLPIIFFFIKSRVPAADFKALSRKLLLIFFSVIFAVLTASFLLDGFSSLRPYLFHSSRPGGVGSMYYLLFQRPLLEAGLEQLNYLGIAVFFLIQMSIPLLFIFYPRPFRNYLKSKAQLIGWVTLAILLFVLFSRFYSPQWIVWFMPFLILLVNRKRDVVFLVVYDVLNYFSFPLIWHAWGPFSTAFTAVSSIIVVLTIVITIFVFKSIRQGKVELAARN